MASRAFQVMGPVMVAVKGGAHTSTLVASLDESVQLGLSSDQIKISPRFVHDDLRCSDFGPSAPPDVQTRLADATISMTLVHYDQFVLDQLLRESLASYDRLERTMAVSTAAKPLGAGLPMYYSGNHLVSLNLIPTLSTSGYLASPYRFRACYLEDQPVVIPVGTTTSYVEVKFRAIPYKPLWALASGTTPPGTVTRFLNQQVHVMQEIASSGVVLWDFNPDLPPD